MTTGPDDSLRARWSRGLAGRTVSLDENHLVVAAMKRSGASDIPAPGCGEPLTVLTRALDERAQLTMAGRRTARRIIVDALADRARLDAAAPVGAEPRLVVVGLPYGAAGLLRRALGSTSETPSPLDGGDDAHDWRLAMADPSWEFRWHVPEFAEWLDEHRAEVTAPSSAAASHGGLAWLGRSLDPADQLVVVRDAPPAADAAAAALSQATVTERALHSTRHLPEPTDRYVRWRMSVFGDRVEAAATGATLVLDGTEVAADPAAAARRVLDVV